MVWFLGNIYSPTVFIVHIAVFYRTDPSVKILREVLNEMSGDGSSSVSYRFLSQASTTVKDGVHRPSLTKSIAKPGIHSLISCERNDRSSIAGALSARFAAAD